MKELIPINDDNGKKTVSAKLLYDFLRLDKSHWARWYKKNIESNEFAIENEDYIGFTLMANGNNTKDFALTLPFAKKLAMKTNTLKGEEARDYFLKCEEIAHKPKEIDFSDARAVLKIAENFYKEQEARKRLEKENKTLKPKAELMDKVMATDTKIDIGQTAKILDLPFGRNILFKKLREKGIFFKNRNEPKQEYIKRGYFELKEVLITPKNSESFIKLKVLVSQKGLRFISKLFGGKPNQQQLALIG